MSQISSSVYTMLWGTSLNPRFSSSCRFSFWIYYPWCQKKHPSFQKAWDRKADWCNINLCKILYSSKCMQEDTQRVWPDCVEYIASRPNRCLYSISSFLILRAAWALYKLLLKFKSFSYTQGLSSCSTFQ